VWVNGRALAHSLLVPWAARSALARGRLDALTRPLRAILLALQPELVIFGSGARLRFVPPRCCAR
jgi:uncharacterized protein